MSPTPALPAPPLERLPELEGLRGLMAWWVVLGHLAYVFSQRAGEALGNGSAVDVFIILSGFVITHLLVQRREAYGPFILRRAFRLFPVYLVILLASALTLGWQMDGLTGSPIEPDHARRQLRESVLLAAQQDFWPHFLAHATLLHGLLPKWLLPYADLTFVGPAWSLSVEWQYYLLAPLAVGLLVARRWALLAALVGTLAGLRLVPGFGGIGAYLPNVLHWFVLGTASYVLWKHREHPLVKRAAPWVTYGGIFAGLAVLQPGLSVWCTGLGVLLGVWPRDRGLGKAIYSVLNSGWAQGLGKSSYPVYLLHMQLIYWVLALANPLLGHGLPLWAWGMLVAGGSIVGTWLLAAALHRWVELPGMRLGARLAAGVDSPGKVTNQRGR